jgi:hypothetical protein
MDDSTHLAAPLRRRHFLGAGAAVTGAALLGAGGAGPAQAATPTAAVTPATAADATTTDAFDQLRGVWSDILTGGSAVNPTDPDYATAIATIDAIAAAAIALYDDSANPTAVYTDLPFTHVENASGSYVYLLLPGASAAETARRAERPDVAVLSNTPALQAIHSQRNSLTAATFFTAGALPSMGVSGPAAVLFREHGGRLTLAVSDPTCTQTSLTVTLSGRPRYRRGFSDDPGVTIDLNGAAPLVTLDLTQGFPGTSRTVHLS